MARESISTSKKPAGRAADQRPARPAQTSALEPITSRDNRWMKIFREALRDGFLPEQKLIGIEGPHLIAEALHSGLEFDACLVSTAGEKHLGDFRLADLGGRVLRTTDHLFESVAATEH